MNYSATLGKAAVATFLWEDVLGQQLEPKLGGIWSHGSISSGNLTVHYRTGPGVQPSKVPKSTTRAVLVLNGHSNEKLISASQWLTALDTMPALKSVGLLFHGKETCVNDILVSFLAKPHHFNIAFVFMVYGLQRGYNDSIPIFQWPLGPAYYRKFPRVPFHPDLAAPHNENRKYFCNFLGTVYKESLVRQLVRDIVIDPENQYWNCFLKYREEWVASETTESQEEYISALNNSDFTLCPPGFNVEAYRIYEAMTFGSVPVLQYDVQLVDGDLQGPGYICTTEPFAFLKEQNAPVVWLSDWSELPDIMNKLKAETPKETYERRFVKPSFISLCPYI